jgi:D-alanyl-D-alanine carboxypeptidase
MPPHVRFWWFLCTFVLFTSAVTSSAATTSNSLFPPDVAKRLDADIENIIRQNNLPSVAVGIFIPDKGQCTFLDGSADLQTHTSRTLDTAILILIDRGVLHKTDPIAKWYPQFPYADQITIDDLLRMRSGIPAPNDDEVLARVYDAPLASAPSFAEEMNSFAQLRSEFKSPNTIGVYTDFNYDILADIVQRVTRKSIGDLITETVIVPLKLSSTSYPTSTGVPGGLHGYGWNPSTKRFDDKTLFNPPLAGAAGAVISNIADLHTFSRVLCKGTLLKPETYKDQMQGQPLVGTNANYGEGVAMGDGVCGHSGTINGYGTDMYYFEKMDLSLVISVNRLDRDNKSQSTAILGLVSKTILSGLGSH